MDAPSKSCRNVLAEFIEIYKDLPQLWDTKCIGYTNRKAREEGYVIFLKRFRMACPTITIKDIKSKINTIRTNFRRELKKVKQSNYNYVSSLWYFDNLRFLIGHLGLQNLQQQQQQAQRYHPNFNFKISNVSSTENSISKLNIPDSILTWCNNVGTLGGGSDNLTGAEETYGTSRIKLNHDPEISSTNKSLQNFDDDDDKYYGSDDDNIEMPPIMSVKVEIPTTPEPDSEEQIQTQNIPTTNNNTIENSISTLNNRPARSTVTVQNPVISKPITRSALGKNIRPNPIKKAINPANRSSTTNPSTQTKIPSKKQNQLLRNRHRTTNNNNQISSNHQERYSDTTEHGNEEIPLKLNSRQNRKRKREQHYHHYDKELLNSLQTHFKEKDDESDLIAQSWAMKLKRLQQDQRIFAEKFIGDIFMEAELGTLTRDSLKIN